MMHAIGVDLGGSHVMATLVDESGELQNKHEIELDDHTPSVVIPQIVKVIRQAIDDAGDAKISGIGIGSPGNVDAFCGMIRYSPNFGWTDVALGEKLREEFTYPVFVANDARCATLGEYVYGAGRGSKNFVLLTLGPGIGGGIIADGELVLGHQMGAGEVGHHQIRPSDGFVCNCGKVGCFEAQASGTGILRHAFAVAPSFPRSRLLDMDRDKLGSKAIRKAAQAGDRHAITTWNNWIADLALGISNVIAFVNPEVIALGGGVSSAGAFMLDALRPLVEEKTTMVPRGTTRIVTAMLGNDAGAVGAGAMAMRGGLHPGSPPLTPR
jgi:glucokinase